MTNTQLDFLRQLRRLAAAPGTGPALDSELLERFAADRDETAFATLVQRHGSMVLSVCRSILRHWHDAEDAFQATFLVLARKAGSIRQREALGSWLYSVAYHAAVKARAQPAQRQVREGEVEDMPAADPLHDLTVQELRRVVYEELQRLPEKYRAPLVHCYLEGQTQEEAARQLGWSKGVLRGRLERGRDALRRRLSQRGLALSMPLLAPVLTADPTLGAVPAVLANATVRAALNLATGATTAGVSPRAAALAEE